MYESKVIFNLVFIYDLVIKYRKWFIELLKFFSIYYILCFKFKIIIFW